MSPRWLSGDFGYLLSAYQPTTVERMRNRSVLLALSFVVLLIPSVLTAQSAPKIDNDFVQRAFGKDFTIIPEVGGMVGDLDGDGVEDVVIGARSKNPLPDQAEHNYTVIDPYYTFFGYGEPTITIGFVDDNQIRRGLVVLIIHGAGPDAWWSATPKSKYVMINLPYVALSVRRMRVGKKVVEAIYCEEGNELRETSAVFFDGKKYKYVPMGSSKE